MASFISNQIEIHHQQSILAIYFRERPLLNLSIPVHFFQSIFFHCIQPQSPCFTFFTTRTLLSFSLQPQSSKHTLCLILVTSKDSKIGNLTSFVGGQGNFCICECKYLSLAAIQSSHWFNKP